MWYLYILLCADCSLYTGIALDPDKRFLEHLEGIGSKYTRSRKPIRIIYREKLPSRSAALKREFEVKSWPRTKKIKQLNLKI